VFKAQAEVELQNLKAQDLNGLKATIVAYDRNAGRYVVLLQESGKSIKIRPENLVAWTGPPASEKVAVPGLRPHLQEAPKVAPTSAEPVAPATHEVSLNSKKNTVAVKVTLPMLESSAGVKLQVSSTDLILTYGTGENDFVRAVLPASVQPDKAASKFYKKSKTMKITIPVQI
jgi:hypothetical protein